MRFSRIFGLWILLATHGAVAAEPSSWKNFLEAKDRSQSDVLTDYSFAGYEHGERAIPDVQGTVFPVTNYGAVPDDAKSDEEAKIGRAHV